MNWKLVENFQNLSPFGALLTWSLHLWLEIKIYLYCEFYIIHFYFTMTMDTSKNNLTLEIKFYLYCVVYMILFYFTMTMTTSKNNLS